MTTVEVEIEIGRNTGGGYPVVARAGEEVATAHLPVPTVDVIDRQLAKIRTAVLASSVLVRPQAHEDEQQVRELGRDLFEALVTGEVRDLYTASTRRVQEDNSTLRLVLGVRPQELAPLPWEFLFDPDRGEYLGLTVPLVRYPEVLTPRQPLQLTGPLRILGMDLSPVGQEVSEADAQQRVRVALAGLTADGAVELGWVAGHERGALVAALNDGPWHAFHLAGLGEQTGEEDVSRSLTDNVSRLLTDDVSRLLTEHDTLRLVVLNACATESGAKSDGFAGHARALLRRGIPAVVTMQFGITDPAASRFAEALYHGAAKCLPVDVAVLRARRALRMTRKASLEWGTPTLYLRAPGGRVFTAPAATASPTNQEPAAAESEVRYDQALEAFWTEQWEQAATLLQGVLTHHPDHPDAAAKLEQARYEQDLVVRYAQACAAVDARDWEQAVAEFAKVADADPTNLDVRDRLAHADRQRESAALKAQQRRERPEPAPPPKLPRLVLHPKPQQVLHTRVEVNAVAFGSEGRVATASTKNLVRIWDTSTGQELLSVRSKSRRRSMEGVVFSPDGMRLATASDDGTARIWDATNGEQLLQVDLGEPVWGVSFSPDGGLLATASDDCTARIWIAANGAELLQVSHDNWVRGVAFSPDGGRLATASVDRTARIWDATSGEELVRFEPDSLLWGVAFSPDGCWLATAGQDGTARIWDATSGEELLRVGLDDQVWAVAFSPDGRCLATASGDRTARIWDVGNGQELAAVVHVDQVSSVAFSPDGSQFATASVDRTVRILALEVRL